MTKPFPAIIIDLSHQAGEWLHAKELQSKFQLWATHCLEQFKWPEELKQVELTVILTNNAEIAELNRDYRNKNSPTNVLSFPSHELNPGQYLEIEQYNGYIHLGDIVLAEEVIIRESIEGNISFMDHLTHLVVHSVLHLLGFDHEIEHDAELMESKEAKILERLGVKNPYQSY